MKPFYKVLFTIAVLSPLFSFAQSNYKEGFVINLKGDTLKGYIDLKEWGSNPKTINFKTALGKSAPQLLTVTDIGYFEIPKVVAYKSFTTSISLNETNIQRITRDQDTSSKTDNVFLKRVQTGKYVTLYSYEDDLKKRYYISNKQSGNVAELIYRIYISKNDGSSNTISKNAYRQQLLLIAQRYDTYSDKLKSNIEEAEYQESDLVGICRKINNTQKEDVVNSNGKYVGFFAGVGGSYGSIKQEGTPIIFNAPGSYSSFGPKISVGLNFYPVPEVRKSILKLELAYTSNGYKITGTDYYDSKIKSTYSMQQHTISVIPQFLYNIYNTDPFKIYLDAGFAANFSSYGGNTLYNSGSQNTQKDIIGLNDHWLSIPFKAGVVLKKNIDVSITYILPESITDNHAGNNQQLDRSLNLQSMQFCLSYIF